MNKGDEPGGTALAALATNIRSHTGPNAGFITETMATNQLQQMLTCGEMLIL